MKDSLKPLACATFLALSACPALAQDGDWEFEASIYLFTPETDVSIGGLEGTLSFSDALDNLDMAFMGAFGARNGRLSFLADFMLTDISFGNDSPGPAFSSLETKFKTQVFSGYAAYSVYQDPTVNVDLAAGFRWFDTSTSMTLTPGAAPGRSVSVSENWVDPVVGVRAMFDLSDKWSGLVFADYGGFRSDSETWQILLTANYHINEKWVARFGYRQLSVDHEINGSDFSFDQSGPIFGATYRF
ncbi:MAG: porin family protein [Paracoccaceae bacterium]